VALLFRRHSTGHDSLTQRALRWRGRNDGDEAFSPLPLSGTGKEHADAGCCSDNSSIMRTVENSLTTTLKRFVGRICNLAEHGRQDPSGMATRGLGIPSA
jgi:hypothetical protein